MLLAFGATTVACTPESDDTRIFEGPPTATSQVDDYCSNSFRIGGVEAPASTPPRAVASTASAVFVATEGSLVRSLDGGSTWEPVDIAEQPLNVFANDSTVLAPGDGVVRISDDRGMTWSALEVEARWIEGGYGVLEDGRFIRWELGGGIEASTDARTWSPFGPPAAVGQTTWIDVQEGVILVEEEQMSFASFDSGESWTTITPPADNASLAAFESTEGPRFLAVVISDPERIYESSDGTSWTPSDALSNNFGGARFYVVGGTVFARPSLGPVKRRDGPGDWSLAPEIMTNLVGGFAAPEPRIVTGETAVLVVDFDGNVTGEYVDIERQPLNLVDAQLNSDVIISSWETYASTISLVVLSEADCSQAELLRFAGPVSVVSDGLTIVQSIYPDRIATDVLFEGERELVAADLVFEADYVFATNDGWIAAGKVGESMRFSRSSDGVAWSAPQALARSAATVAAEPDLSANLAPSKIGRTDAGFFAVERTRLYESSDFQTWELVDTSGVQSAGASFVQYEFAAGQWFAIPNLGDGIPLHDKLVRGTPGEWVPWTPPFEANDYSMFVVNDRVYLLLSGDPDLPEGGTLLMLYVYEHESDSWSRVDANADGYPPLDSYGALALRKVADKLVLWQP